MLIIVFLRYSWSDFGYREVIVSLHIFIGRGYFYKEKHRNDIETDFLLSNESKTDYKVNPIEVKSSKNYTTKTLEKLKEVFGKKIDNQIIIHPKTFSIDDNITKIPPYMVWIAL